MMLDSSFQSFGGQDQQHSNLVEIDLEGRGKNKKIRTQRIQNPPPHCHRIVCDLLDYLMCVCVYYVSLLGSV